MILIDEDDYKYEKTFTDREGMLEGFTCEVFSYWGGYSYDFEYVIYKDDKEVATFLSEIFWLPTAIMEMMEA